MPVAKELTELVEINPTRVDLVKTPASGFPILLMKAAAKDVDKKGRVDETPDVTNAEAVLRLLAQLIQSEARELEAGQWGEICDIEMLAGAAYILNGFRRMEQYNAEEIAMCKELEGAIQGRATELGVSDPLSAIASKDADTDMNIPTTDEDQADGAAKDAVADAPVEKSLTELVAEEVAKAVTPLAERNKALEAEMAVLKATPLPGSPVVTAPVSKAAEKDATVAKEIARFEHLASTVQDRELARYYAERAADLQAGR